MRTRDEDTPRGWYGELFPARRARQVCLMVGAPKSRMLQNTMWWLTAIVVLGTGIQALHAVDFGDRTSSQSLHNRSIAAVQWANSFDQAVPMARPSGRSGAQFHHALSVAHLHMTFSQDAYYCNDGLCHAWQPHLLTPPSQVALRPYGGTATLSGQNQQAATFQNLIDDAQTAPSSRPSIPFKSAVPPYTPGSRRIPVAPVPSVGLWRPMTLKQLTFHPDGSYQVPVSQADFNAVQDASAALQQATGTRVPTELLLAQAAQRTGLHATSATGIFGIARATQRWIEQHAPRSLGLRQFSPSNTQQAAEAMGWYDAYLQRQLQTTTGDKGWMTTLLAETTSTTPSNMVEPPSSQQADNDLAAASNMNTQMQTLSTFIQSEVKALDS